MTTMNQYLKDFQVSMQSKMTYGKVGNGAFVHSCFTHCEALKKMWNTIKVNGTTIQQAFSKWWHSESEAASLHSYASCLYKVGHSPQQCNPTCPASISDEID